MPTLIPSYLKLHTEDAAAAGGADGVDLERVAELCRAFHDATGWPLRYVPQPEPPHDIDLIWSAPVNPGVGATPGHLRIDLTGQGQIDADAAIGLAGVLADFVNELAHARAAPALNVAGLAAGLNVRRQPSRLAGALQATLKAAAQAIEARAAALYLLDEHTTRLELTAGYGLAAGNAAAATRELSGATADLEALLGHAVALEDAKLFDFWKPPAPCAAAICVPISSATTPLGTLWVFCEEPRLFNDHETNLIEILAGRIAAELEHDALVLAAGEHDRWRRQHAAAARLQRSQCPQVAPLCDGWDVAAWRAESESISGGFYDWFLTAAGKLAFVACHAEGEGLEAALTAATLRGALRACGQQADGPGKLLTQTNETLCATSAGEQFASVFCGLIDPDAAEVRHAAAGNIAAYVLRPSGAERLDSADAAIGVQPGAAFPSRPTSFSPGDSLLLIGRSERSLPANDGALEATIRSLQGGMHSAAQLLNAIRENAIGATTMLVLKRR